MRQRATQCLGKQLPDKPHSRPCNSTSRWSGHHVRWHEEQESSKLIRTSSSPVVVASERVFRSRETVKAWLESSPTSVLEDLDDESACPSSFESSNSSPVGSVDHLSCTTRFQNPIPKSNPPGHARVSIMSILVGCDWAGGFSQLDLNFAYEVRFLRWIYKLETDGGFNVLLFAV